MSSLRLTLVLAICCGALALAQRSETTLNGQWETTLAETLDALPVDAAWEPAPVPGTFRNVRGEKRWLRRQITVPAEWRGRRLTVVYDGVKYRSVHYLNGRRVGEHFRGYDRFEIDITAAVRWGQANELLVGVRDWQSTFTEPVDLTGKPGGHAARGIPQDVGLTPLGGRLYDYGIWADVRLVAVDPVHVSDITIVTSVRKRTLSVTAELVNAGDGKVQSEVVVSVGPDAVLEFEPVQLELAPGARSQAAWEVPWAEPRLWRPDDPHLYALSVEVRANGDLRDRRRTRFGFREFWCDGPYFYLNGIRLLLRSTSMWPLSPPDKEAAKEHLAKLKDSLNTICFRTHTQPWRQYWYEAADEVGMLMIPEGPVFNDDNIYRLDDPRFWDNYAGELRSMVQRLKNNPSVVMYSLENEFWGSRMNDKAPSKPQLVRMGTLMRQWDPTRPFMYESDGDPGGVADVVGVHYPHEMGENVLYPNTCYWLDAPKKSRHQFTDGDEFWQWDRKKPLYIGEYLWSPCPTPKRYTTFFGDEAYRDYALYQNRAIALAWSFQTRVYRYYRVSGLCPWTCAGNPDPETNPMAAAQAEAMRPLAAFPKEYTTRFFAGSSSARTLHVMNDTLRAGRVRLTWTFEPEGQPRQSDSQTFTMLSADTRVIPFDLVMPEVDEVTPAVLTIRAEMRDVPPFEEIVHCQVYPKVALYRPRRQVGVFGDAAFRALTGAGLDVVAVNDLAAIPAGTEVLIVGPDALPEWRPEGATRLLVPAAGPPGRAALGAWVREGGRVLLCAQTREHRPLGPVVFEPRAATMVFPFTGGHPVLDGIEADDLKFWMPDHIVAAAQVRRLACGGRPLLVSGGSEGIAWSPLSETRLGQGVIIACGLRVISALGDEPVAGRILGNLLQYLDGDALASSRRCLAVGVRSSTRRTLQSLPFAVAFPDAIEPGNLDGNALVLCGSSCDAVLVGGVVERLAASGGTLWWHRPDPDAYSTVMTRFGLDSRLSASSGPVKLVRPDEVTDGLASADLWWPAGPQKGQPGWARQPLDPSIIEWQVGQDVHVDTAKARSWSCLEMTITGSEWNRPAGDFVILASRGSVVGAVECAQTGPHAIGFKGKGSAACGVWPAVQVSLDGEEIGQVWVDDESPGVYGVEGHVTAGKHEIALTFTNDAQIDGEDRNVYLAELYVHPVPAKATRSVRVHAVPAALASAKVGKAELIIDTVKWDEPGAHVADARGYPASLLAKLGVPARGSGALASMEAEDMRLEEVAYNTTGTREVVLANEGSVWASVVVEAAVDGELCIYARGKAAADEWPVLVVKIDGGEAGRITVDAAAMTPFAIPLKLAAGTYELEMRYINDLYVPGEADRNCYIDKVEIRRRPL